MVHSTLLGLSPVAPSGAEKRHLAESPQWNRKGSPACPSGVALKAIFALGRTMAERRRPDLYPRKTPGSTEKSLL